VAGVWR